MKDELLVLGVSVKEPEKTEYYYEKFLSYMKKEHLLYIEEQTKAEKWLMPHIRPGCTVDYGRGRILFAGEIAGFLNPMGEGISAGMESGYQAAEAAASGAALRSPLPTQAVGFLNSPDTTSPPRGLNT